MQTAESTADRDQPPARARARRGLRLGEIVGVEIRLDWSVALIFALVVATLGAGTLASWHPEWSTALRWGVALAAGLLFFASILVHELAHSVVALGYGIPVPRITLFLFGGLSEMESEPERPWQEFAIAIVGPLASLAIGLVCLGIGAAIVPAGFSEQLTDDPEAAVASLGVVSTLLLWLGPINVMLGVFNLVPGFPLDGGRVLRAAIWAGTGDRVTATTWASRAGQVVAFGLIALGIFEVLGGNLSGLWLMFIGWFLNNAARSSHARMLLEDSLTDLRVGDLMRTRVEEVRQDMPLDEFVAKVLPRSDQGIWPVVDPEGRPVGSVSVASLRAASPEDGATVQDVATPVEAAVSPDDDALEAVRELWSSSREALLVMRDGVTVGLLRPRDIGRWLSVAQLQT